MHWGCTEGIEMYGGVQMYEGMQMYGECTDV